MNVKSISIILYIIGIAYMALYGWLVSWWFVPDYRVGGTSFFTNSSFSPFGRNYFCYEPVINN